MHDCKPHLFPSSFPALSRTTLETLQVNLGYLCNLTCTHCHVNAGPKRTEIMSKELAVLIPKVLKKHNIKTLDLTGGAPEMNPHFRRITEQARELNVTVIDRCNLVILQEPGYEDLANFLAQNQVQIIASLPCYMPQNVERQRGKGVFESSIEALKKLNQLGYGQPDSNLELHLVFNPNGPKLPPTQEQLEDDYKQHLWQEHKVRFNQLFTITNMPINRFGSQLISLNQFQDYLALLKENHKPENLKSVMCRTLVSVDWQGYLYDCDFNQMLNLPVKQNDHKYHLRDLLESTPTWPKIQVGEHCYGCTAGSGSSCSGALK